jgi:hypothetical protein
VLVEMGISILYLACLRGLKLEVRVWGWCGEEDLSGPGGELPDFSTVAFILDFMQSHMTVQHTGNC